MIPLPSEEVTPPVTKMYLVITFLICKTVQLLINKCVFGEAKAVKQSYDKAHNCTLLFWQFTQNKFERMFLINQS